ncbi:MAG: zinc ribbon domain-containing protein [Firmicutes bacterium]|nr:zinc ribbon domain-containing protein [Bacillota bacterium]
MAEIICASCQKAVPFAEENDIRFCPFCGAKLALPTEEPPPSAENTALLAAFKAKTLEGVGSLQDNLRPRGIVDWILGSTSRWNDGVTGKFIDDTQAAARALAQGLAREPDADIARDATEFILFGLRETLEEEPQKNKNAKNSMELLLAATERNALNFIPFLREEDKTGIGARYQATHKKSSLLPVQKDILKLLLKKSNSE